MSLSLPVSYPLVMSLTDGQFKFGSHGSYPSFTINALDLLKQPQFRIDILSPENAKKIMDDMLSSVRKDTGLASYVNDDR